MKTYSIGTVTKDTHLPIRVGFLDPVIAEDLFELESILRQGDIVGLGIPFFETSKFVTVAQLPTCQ
jgi:hypothetical protein